MLKHASNAMSPLVLGITIYTLLHLFFRCSVVLRYHPGVPNFRDGCKSWSCCGAKAYDWEEFLALPTCTTGRFSARELYGQYVVAFRITCGMAASGSMQRNSRMHGFVIDRPPCSEVCTEVTLSNNTQDQFGIWLQW